MHARVLVSMVLVTLVSLGASAAQEEQLERFVTQDAWLFVRVNREAEGIDDTQFGRLLKEPGIEAFTNQLANVLSEILSTPATGGLSLQNVFDLLEHEFVFALVPPAVPEEKKSADERGRRGRSRLRQVPRRTRVVGERGEREDATRGTSAETTAKAEAQPDDETADEMDWSETLANQPPRFLLIIRTGGQGSTADEAADNLVNALTEMAEMTALQEKTDSGARAQTDTDADDEDDKPLVVKGTEIHRTVSPLPGGELAYAKRGDAFLLGSTTDVLEEALEGPERPLPLAPQFRRARRGIDADAVVVSVYYNNRIVMNTLRELGLTDIVKVLQDVGLAGVTAYDAFIFTDGEGIMARGSLKVFKRQGLLADVAAAPVDEEALRLVPRDVGYFEICTIDWTGLYKHVVALAGVLPSPTGEDLASKIAAFEGEAGVNIQQDLLAALGQQYVCFGPSSAPDSAVSAGVFLVGCSDESAFDTFVRTIVEYISSLVAELPAAGPFGQTPAVLASVDYRDHQIRYLRGGGALSMSVPAYTFTEGHLVASSSVMALKEYLDFLTEGGPNATSNEDFLALREKVAADGTAIMYGDFKRGFLTMYKLGAALLEMFDGFLPNGPDAALLPPPKTLAPYLFGAIGVTSDMPGEIRYESYSPVGLVIGDPGNLLSPDVVGPFLAGLLKPALSQAGGEALNAQSRGNLRQIGLAMVIYANDHRGQGPRTLKGLVDGEYLVNESVLRDPRLSPSQRTGDTDYVLRREVSIGTLKLTDKPGEPVVWSDPTTGQEMIEVLYGDGSALSCAVADLPESPREGVKEWPGLVAALKRLYQGQSLTEPGRSPGHGGPPRDRGRAPERRPGARGETGPDGGPPGPPPGR